MPQLLDEVHWLEENTRVRFALCGSSARKVKRGAANLLGGRAVRYELHGLTASEIGAELDLDRILNHGYLPRPYLSDRPQRLLNAYVADYLKEEIAAEGVVRNLPVFSRFLESASLSDTELVKLLDDRARLRGLGTDRKRLFRDPGRHPALPLATAHKKRPKRRVIGAPKFYFADVGIVNHLARRGALQPGSELYGKAFENWVFHELAAHNAYRERFAQLSHWRLASGIEVDFIVNDLEVAIEAKATAKVKWTTSRGCVISPRSPRVRQRVSRLCWSR